LSSEEDDSKEPSGTELRQKSRSEQEDEGRTTIITNANSNVGQMDLDKPNIADGFKKSQIMVNSDGTEI
jgi:hypothetical protein